MISGIRLARCIFVCERMTETITCCVMTRDRIVGRSTATGRRGGPLIDEAVYFAPPFRLSSIRCPAGSYTLSVALLLIRRTQYPFEHCAFQVALNQSCPCYGRQ